MSVETAAEMRNINNHLSMSDSEDSEEEFCQEEQPVTPWNELSILERVGLNSVEMSEEEVETTFIQIALAFRSDQYTLKQRLQAEEHARNLAEENVQLELTRGRETLETLKDLCLDSKRSNILQRLELSLDILGGTVERISNTAEVLGAVHQEARASRAVEVMVAHVENLKNRHDRDLVELEETKKLLQRNPRRSRLPPDTDDIDAIMDKKIAQEYHGRRRVSTSLISKETQEKRKQDSRKQVTQEQWSKEKACPSPALSSESSCSTMTRDDIRPFDDSERLLVDPDEAPSEASAVQIPPELLSLPNPEGPTPPPRELIIKKTQSKNSPLDTLRQRHKGKAALSKKKAGKDKKSTHSDWQLSVRSCSPFLKQHPVVWFYRCCWALLCTFLVVLLCVTTLTVFS